MNVCSSGTALNYTTATSATWLLVTPASGSTPGSLSVSVNPGGLAAGTYTGNVTVTAAGASNSPKTVPVSLTVTAAQLPTLRHASPRACLSAIRQAPQPRRRKRGCQQQWHCVQLHDRHFCYLVAGHTSEWQYARQPERVCQPERTRRRHLHGEYHGYVCGCVQ